MSKRTMQAFAVAGVAVGWFVGVAVPAAVGASAKPASAAQWSATVCSSVTSWQNSVTKNYTDLSSQLSNVADLGSARSEFVATLEQDVALSDQTATKLARLGAPKVKNGAKIANAFTHAFQDAKSRFGAAQAQAAALPTDDSDAFQTAGAPLEESMSSATDPVNAAFSDLNGLDTSGNLLQAMAKQKSCKPYVL